MTNGTRIIVLGKPPRPGACKSRLAATVGDARAARLNRAFLFDTWALVSSFVSQKKELDLVFAQTASVEEYPLLTPGPTIIRQGEGDLGRRMATLIAGALDQREQVILIGTDSPGLPDSHLEQVLKQLEETPIVLGPNPDGGFWCLGMRGSHPALSGNTWLDDLDWEKDSTREQVEERLSRLNVAWSHGPEWVDVDHEKDLTPLVARLEKSEDGAPATMSLLNGETHPAGPLSIIIPSLNENVRLDRCLDAVEKLEGDIEIIVADGGSGDKSPERAAARGIPVVVTAPSRGRQLSAGAMMATGRTYLFLHVDTQLPENAPDLIEDTLSKGAEAGAFLTHTVRDNDMPNRAGPLLRLADIRSRLTRRPYGDQALFVTREAYEAVGGFRPDLPIMEDWELSSRLAKRKPIVKLPQTVTVSGRRIQTHPLRSLFVLRLVPLLFRLGVSPRWLGRLYHQK